MSRISLAEAHELSVAVLEAAGTPPGPAGTVARSIVYAEASTISSHGLVRVPYLADQVRSGKIRAAERPRITEVPPSTILVDARHGFGYVAAHAALAGLVAGLERTPVTMAAISNSHHFGVAGLFVERIAEAGYVGLATSNTFAAVALTGARTPLIGNDPFAGGFPRAGGEPVVIDFAPAVAARGRIVKADQEGEPIPDSWALDAAGRPTSIPAQALKGSLQAIGGYKGVALAMLLDLLVAATTTSNLPGDASSVYDSEGPPPGLGHLIIGINPSLLGVSNFADICERYVRSLMADSACPRIPGEHRRAARSRAQTEGVEVSARLLRDLRSRAALMSCA